MLAVLKYKSAQEKIKITKLFPPFSELFSRSIHKKPRRANLNHKSAQKKIKMTEFFASLALFFPRLI
jgi:hypothetical protein